MKQQPFDEWVLAAEDLTPEQAKALQEHLSTCKNCQALVEADCAVRSLLTDAAVISPDPGFVQRWEERLNRSRQKAHRRQVSIVLGVSAVAAGIILSVFSVKLLWLLASLDDLLIDIFWEGFRMIEAVALIGHFGTTFIDVLSGVVSPLWGIALISLIVGLCVLWFISLYRIGHQNV